MTAGPRLLLVTAAAHPEGEPGHEVLDRALAERGIASEWAVWDDPFVDWSRADLIAIRSTWDYELQVKEFLGWARSLGRRLLHGVDVLRWNTDRRYLVELARHGRLPVVPTVLADSPVSLRAAVGRFGPSVVRPRVGGRGQGIVVHDAGTRLPLDPGPCVVQPLVESVYAEGVTSVVVIDGHPVAQVRTVADPAYVGADHPHDPTVSAVGLTGEASLLAVDAVAATTELIGAEIVYARVDLLRHQGELSVSEVEVTQPRLHLDVVPVVAQRYADAVAQRLGPVA